MRCFGASFDPILLRVKIRHPAHPKSLTGTRGRWRLVTCTLFYGLAMLMLFGSLQKAQAQVPNYANGENLYKVAPACTNCHAGNPFAANATGIANAGNSPGTILTAATCPGGITYAGVNSCTQMNDSGPGSVQETVGPSAPNGAQNRVDVAYYIGDFIAPVLHDGSASTAFNTPVTIDLTPFISGYNSSNTFTFTGGNAKTITITTGPTNGGAAAVSGLSVQYTPSSTASGIDDTFFFSATSPQGVNSSGSAKITVHIGAAPIPNAPSFSVGPFVYQSLNNSIDLSSHISAANPGPPAGYATGLGSPTSGTATANGGTITNVSAPFLLTYNAPTNKITDHFTYTVSGPGGTSAAGTVTVQITPPNPPTAVPGFAQNAGFNPGPPSATSFLIDITGAFTGPVNSYGTPVEVPGANNGTVVAGPGFGKVTYTPKSLAVGMDMFTISATNPGGTTTATVTINVQPPAPPGLLMASVNTNATYNNGPPAAQTTINLSSGVFSGFVQGLTVNGATLPVTTTHGTVAQGPTAESLLYTPALGFHATDTLQVRAFNLNGSSAASAVAVTTLLPGPPVGHNLAVPGAIAYNTATPIDLTSSITGVLLTSNPVTITQPAHGVATINGKLVTYTPLASYFSGPDSFTYTAIGPGGSSAPATVTLVDALPAPPNAAAKSVNVTFNSATQINVQSLVTGVSSSVAVSSPPGHGTTSVSGYVITYTPNAGYLGPDVFSYTSSGPGGTSPAAAISLTVTALPTVAPSVTIDVPLNSPTTVDLAKFITGSGITGVQITTQPAHGNVSVNGTQITYSPVFNFFGADNFTYRAFGASGSSNGTITVQIVGRPNPAQNADVTGLIDAQISEARVFTRTQISNFQQRMDNLHRGSPSDSNDNAPNVAVSRTNGAAAVAAGPSAPASIAATLDPSAASISASPSGAMRSALPLLASARTEPAPGPGTPAADPFADAPVSALQALPGETDNGQFRLPSQAQVTSSYRNGVGATSTTGATLASALPFSMSSIDLASVAGAVVTSSDPLAKGGVWVAGAVDFGNREQPSGLPNGLKFHSDGLSLGADHRFTDNLIAGLGLGYAFDQTEIGTDGTQSKASGTVVAAYASYQPTPNTYLDAVVGVGSLDFNSVRTVASIDAVASGHRTGEQAFASLTAGYDLRLNELHISPYGRLDIAEDRLHEYTETGAGLNALTYAQQNVPTEELAFGVRLDAQHQTSFGTVTPHARLEYEHDFEGQSQTSVAYADLFGGPSYGVTSNTVNRNALVGGVGVDFNLQRGLAIGLDYQALRSSGNESSQMVRVRLTQELDSGLLPNTGLLLPVTFTPVGLRADASYTYDDNVTRSTGEDKLSDQSYSLHVTRPFLLPLLDNAQAIVTPFAGGEKFDTYGGLNHAVVGLNAELQYRASGEFASPIYAIFLHSDGEDYSSYERTGYRYSVGLSLTKPLTDRISLFGAVAYDDRHGNSAVFDDQDGSVRLNLDYATSQHGTLYVSGEYRRGDVVSTGQSSLANLDIASVAVHDDVFSDGIVRNAYRIRADTYLLGIGYNYALGETDALDFSYRWAQSTPLHQPNFANADFVRYFDNQFTVVYLVRF